MSTRRRRRYSAQERQDAVNLVLVSGLTVHRAAMDLGIPPGTLDRWGEIARSRASSKGEPEMTEDERNELKRLRREVATLRQERDFLKKAAAFFAKENDPRSR